MNNTFSNSIVHNFWTIDISSVHKCSDCQYLKNVGNRKQLYNENISKVYEQFEQDYPNVTNIGILKRPFLEEVMNNCQ